MRPVDVTKIRNCEISTDAKLEADYIDIGEGVTIEDGVSIRAKTITLGMGTKIERATKVAGLNCDMNEFSVGDNCLIGFNNQILSPAFSMKDYSQLHNSGLHSGYKPLRIGYNCWIGQGTILNCTESLTIGNNVRIGTQSQLWTHVASGELLEGCTLIGFKPVVVEDNVWIVGGAIISPGLILGANSIIMTGSVVTKSTKPFRTVAGVPARDVTDKLNFWRPITVQEKMKMIQEFIDEFTNIQPNNLGKIHALHEIDSSRLDRYQHQVVIVPKFSEWAAAEKADVSVFDLTSKRYLKRRSQVEIDWMRWSLGYRARFVPYEGLDR